MSQEHGTATFNPSSFERLKKAEERFFWFQVRRRWIFDRIKRFIPPPAGLIEIGCGTGNVSRFLSQKGYSVTGCEYYHEAIETAWQGFRMVQGDANKLPFKDGGFDVVGLFDVIEHFQDDTALLKEAVRVVKRGRIVVITVPAREELWSHIDDRALHKRRYTKERFKEIFSEVKLNPLCLEYMFMSLYLPMKYVRRENKRDNNHFRINRLTNTILKVLFNTERFISKTLPLPIGTSLIAIARKDI